METFRFVLTKQFRGEQENRCAVRGRFKIPVLRIPVMGGSLCES